MPTYVLLGALNHEGRKSLHANPERIAEVRKEITDLGCKVLHQYSLLGPYDLLTVVEAPDHETVAHVAADLHSRGTAGGLDVSSGGRRAPRAEAEGPQEERQPLRLHPYWSARTPLPQRGQPAVGQ